MRLSTRFKGSVTTSCPHRHTLACLLFHHRGNEAEMCSPSTEESRVEPIGAATAFGPVAEGSCGSVRRRRRGFPSSGEDMGATGMPLHPTQLTLMRKLASVPQTKNISQNLNVCRPVSLQRCAPDATATAPCYLYIVQPEKSLPTPTASVSYA